MHTSVLLRALIILATLSTPLFAQETVITINKQQSSELVKAVETCLNNAINNEAPPIEGIYGIHGMSGRKYRFFINSLIKSLDNPSYLEIGTWAGSTFCSAIHGNKVRAVAIDNWSEFGGGKDLFFKNIQTYMTPEVTFTAIEQDFRGIDYASLGTFNVYLFDGPHSEKDQFDALNLPLKSMEDEFVFIVDDWNLPEVRKGTLDAIKSNNLTILYSAEIRTTHNNTHPTLSHEKSFWHNGYYIAVLIKEKPKILESTPLTKCQQLLIDNMKESLSKKKTSEELNEEFARLLVEKQIKGALLKISTAGNGTCSYETVINYIPPAESEDRISSTINILKKYLGGFSLEKPLVFYIPVMDFFNLFNEDFQIFDQELETFIADHIILLAPENLLASQRCFTMIPDFFILKRYQDKIESLNKHKAEIPFEARKPLAKFIGSASGRRPFLVENIALVSRLNAFHLSKTAPDLLEINFSYYTASDEYLRLNYGPYSPWMTHEQLLQYRYLLSFDGYTSAWERPEIIMHSGSVPLFQTRFEKFWTVLLQDGVNYIKIQDDLSNLLTSVKSLNDNPEQAKEIAKQAQLLANEVLTADFFNKYMTALFKEIARVQKVDQALR